MASLSFSVIPILRDVVALVVWLYSSAPPFRASEMSKIETICIRIRPR